MRAPLTLLLPALVLLCGAGPASSQQPPPSVQEIIEKLRPEAQPAALTRRLMLRGVQIEDPQTVAPVPSGPPTIDLSVNFEFGSAQLTTDARIVLDNLGHALSDPALRPYRFLIAGHTDGVGRPDVNLRLSEARARSVATYLERAHGIAAERLTAKGYGATQLLYKDDPANALNRRVQVTTLMPGS